VTPTVTTAGTTINTVPERASVHIDARAWTRAELERVDQELRQLRPAQPEADLTLHGHIDRLPFQPHSAQLLLAAAEAAARDVGLPPLRANRSGVASDANITAAIGIPTLDGLGAIGAHPHARSERADVTSMPTRAAFLAATLQRAVKLGN
jgi:glutamate carboxypeptidase